MVYIHDVLMSLYSFVSFLSSFRKHLNSDRSLVFSLFMCYYISTIQFIQIELFYILFQYF